MKTKTRKTQYRTFDIQIREAADAPTQIFGYAAVFNQPAYGEVIMPGAFTKTLQEQKDIKAYWSHDRSMPLGRTTNGTLTLRQDDHGLYVEITPDPETTWGRNALAAINRGDVSQMSFGFDPITVAQEIKDGESLWLVKEARLREVSPVSEPWYEGTEVSARDYSESNAAETPEPDAIHSTEQAQARRLIEFRELEFSEV